MMPRQPVDNKAVIAAAVQDVEFRIQRMSRKGDMITHAEVEELFPDVDVVLVPGDRVPPEITGAVYQVHRTFGARPMASGPASFVRILAIVDKGVRVFDDEEPDPGEHFAQVRADTLARLHQVDPAIARTAEASWNGFFDDCPEDI